MSARSRTEVRTKDLDSNMSSEIRSELRFEIISKVRIEKVLGLRLGARVRE